MIVTTVAVLACVSCAVDPLGTTPQDAPRTVTPGLTISPRASEVLVGGTVQLTASFDDGATDTLSEGVTWSATGGSIDENGLYDAPLESGTYAVVARTSDGRTDTATVTSLLFLNGFEVVDDVAESQWTSETCCTYSTQLATTRAREGSAAVRFEVRRSDPQVNLGVRSELRLPTPGATGGIGDDRWYGFSIFIPDTWGSEQRLGESMVQWHAQPDRHLGEQWRSPPLMIMIQGDQWSVVSRSDPNPRTNSARAKLSGNVIWTGPLERGRWTDWVVHAKWSYEADGLLDLWKDGNLVANKAGPNTYNDREPLYFKMGIYSWEWKTSIQTPITERIAFHDAVRIAGAGGSYESVKPRGVATR